MRTTAARLHQHGGPLRVEAVGLADPRAGEVVVDMAYAGVNPVDGYGVLGRVAADGPLPRTLGGEGSGTVGDRRVVVRGHGLGATRDGLWAVAAVVPDDALVDVPEGVGLAEAAAMGIAGITSWRSVTELGRVTAGDRVLVLGASGGVGSIAVSVAAALGATVWGQTGTEAKAAWVRDRGVVDVVVGGADEVRSQAAAFEPTVVIDPLGGPFTGAAVEVAAPGGRLVVLGTSAGPDGTVPLQAFYRKGLTAFGYGGLREPDAVLTRALQDALAALADGRLQVAVDTTLPLARVGEALDRIAGRRVRGKVLLDLRG